MGTASTTGSGLAATGSGTCSGSGLGMATAGDSSNRSCTGTGGAGGADLTDSTMETASAFGSQAWHSRTDVGISRPHSGQIQWNMNQMYTVMDCMPFRHTPYKRHLGTLSLIGIQSQGKFKAGGAAGLTC